MKTGKDGLGISSENRQAIQSLLVSQQKAKPNQSARALVKGIVGSAITSLVDFREDPGASDAIFTSSLLVKLEERGFIAYNSDLDRVVLQPSATSSDSSAVASASRSSDSPNVTSSQSGGGVERYRRA